MSFIQDIYEFRKSFRHIEKLTLRCVHLKNAVEFNETCFKWRSERVEIGKS